MNAEEYLREQGKPHDIIMSCANSRCSYKGPAATFALVGKSWVCSNCYHEANRPVDQDQDDWKLEKGNDVRAVRNALLSKHAWTVTPILNEALTEESVAEWTAYIKLLNSLTIDYPKPSKVVWPAPPTPVYK